MRTALDQSFGIIPPDIAARLDGDENAPIFDYFREPTLDELLNASSRCSGGFMLL
jgi:hypothetical protein